MLITFFKNVVKEVSAILGKLEKLQDSNIYSWGMKCEPFSS